MLSIRNLIHVYPGGTWAPDDVSLEIPASMFGLLGPNGAGKSTLMRCIAALQTPTSGAIHFDGIDPCNKRIDRNSGDNVTRVKVAG